MFSLVQSLNLVILGRKLQFRGDASFSYLLDVLSSVNGARLCVQGEGLYSLWAKPTLLSGAHYMTWNVNFILAFMHVSLSRDLAIT